MTSDAQNNRRMKITAAGLAMNLRGVQEAEG